jgi:hypothetical protein
MASVAFGRFTLLDVRGDATGRVIIAPECILLQPAPAARVRDVSYLALWSAGRVEAIANELATLTRVGSTIVDRSTPELHAILHAIAPATAPVFVGAGECRRRFARRRLKAELERSAPHDGAVARRR